MKLLPLKATASIILYAALYSSTTVAQSNVWTGLTRSQFDTPALTLRIPCATLKDANGNALLDFAPAYALNLLLSSDEPGQERFRLVEPMAELLQVPDSCLDTLTVSNDLSTATYTTSSAEIDSDAAVYRDRFYTLELEANLLQSPIEFSVVEASGRDYRKPIYTGEKYLAFIGPPPFTTQFIFDDDFLTEAFKAWAEGLAVFEPGRVETKCFFNDPDNLLEVFEVVGTNTRYKLKPSVTAADNGKEIYTVCTAFNHDINRLEKYTQIYTWTIAIY
ncbi:MAG: hypothetical protein CMQ41_03075 [Gammaproteobacteria bacterium]|nr:hypothetical protein [Gammaproteobacteria bacterium]